ncbi:similar to TSG118.1 (predicted), isoform CRA_c [Rattus norvegicus]|nr:similar to TSG118.1 (predicted), isoform CRA_c [Rattus norvegicus]
MVNKTQKEDLGPRLPEKKKKKKKKKKVANVSEPETQYSVLNNNDYFIDVSPPRATSPFNNVGEVQVPEMSLGKRKKKKKSCSTHLDEYLGKDEPTWTRQIKSPSPRRQVLEQSAEGLIREKKKKRRKSLSKVASQGSGLKTSPDSKHAKEVSKAGRKPKKHRKEKKLPDMEAFPPQDSWIPEAGDALHSCLEGAEAEEQAALGHKRKQGSPRDHSMKKKKKKKTHQEGDILPVNSKISMENSLKKGSKKSVRSEALDFIPIDSLKAPGKKKVKSKKKVEQPVGEGLAVKRKKKKRRKESGVKEDPWQEEKEAVRHRLGGGTGKKRQYG